MSTPEEQLHPGPEITLWAPYASRVEIEWAAPEGAGALEPMEPKGDGWWRWQAPALRVGRGTAAYPALDCAFRGDGGEATPEPRSAWQPHGVHGRSRWFDVARHEWRDATWAGPQQGDGVLGAVVYELHVGT